MRRTSFARIGALLAAAFLLAPPLARAVVVQGVVVDVPDVVPGEQRHRAIYWVTSFDGLGPGSGVSIRIPLDTAGYLATDSPSASDGWQAEILVRDAAIPADGRFDLLALAVAPSRVAPSSFEFVWDPAAGPPVLPNAAEVYDPQFAIVESITVPEPAVGRAVIVGALAWLLALRGGRAHPRVRRTARASALLAVPIVGIASLVGAPARALDEVRHTVSLGDYSLEFWIRADDGIRVGQTFVEYPLSAIATNGGSDDRPFAIQASASSPVLAVVGGSFVFPGLETSSSASAEGIVIRIDRRAAFDPLALEFSIEHAGDQTCSVDGDCASNHCRNGYCCATGECCGLDANCDGFDVAASCTDAATCQGVRTDGVCNGLSQCETVVVEDDSGCLGQAAADCTPFAPAVCSALPDQTTPACRSICTSDGDCASGHHCEDSLCVPNRPIGSACDATAQCGSGLTCVDGVCCSSSCAGTCDACNLQGSVGTCTAIPAGEDPDDECGAVSCAGFYAGFVGDTCFQRADLPANAVACGGASACQTAASLCPAAPTGSALLTCDALCQDPLAGTCVGTNAGQCLDVDPGTTTCGSGVCQTTSPLCQDGAPLVCVPNAGNAGPETCNDLDDDCDGTVDNSARFVDSFEPNDGCVDVVVLQTVGSSQSRSYSTQTVYGFGDLDYYAFTALETDATCSCCDPIFCTDEDFRIQLTLTAPIGGGAYELCTGSTCGGVTNQCVTVAPGQTRTLTTDLDGACPVGTDSYPRFVRVRGTMTPGFECAPYQLTYSMTPGCF